MRATDVPGSSQRIWSELALIGRRMREVWRFISPQHRRALAATTLVMALGAWFNAQVAVALGDLATTMERMKKAGDEYSLEKAVPFLAWLVVCFLLREGLQVVRKYLVHSTTTRVEKETTVALVSHLLKVNLATLSRERVGAIHGRIRRSIEGLEKLLRLGFMDFFPALVTAGFALGVAIHRQPTIGLLMGGVIPVATFIVVRQISSQKGIRLAVLRSKEELDGTVVEQLAGIEYVRVAGTHTHEIGRVERVAESVREREIKHHVAMSFFDSAKALNEGMFFIAVVGVSISFAARGAISIGEIVTYAMLFGSVLTPLREVHRILDEAHESSLRMGDLMHMLAEPEDRSFDSRAAQRPRFVAGAPVIEVANLRIEFEASNGTKSCPLDGVSLTIRHGETIGVAGPTASGKSTWVRTLLRLVHPSAGTFLFGGVPIESVSRGSISELVGYVGQTPFVFAGTVAENIAYGCGAVSSEEIRRAAQMACIDEEIMAMPGAYQAEVAERGQNLSGGQRQRLALARLFLKKPAPPVLILDEGTSALDTIRERSVHRAIAAASQDRTVVIVAHRLSTLLEADRIFVFNERTIAEVGSYSELVAKRGVFSELVRNATAVADDRYRALAP